MKNIFFCLTATFFLLITDSCRKENVAPQTANLTIGSFHESNNTWAFQPLGSCYGSINWSASNIIAEVFQSGNSYWMDSLNYVIRQPLPITITSNSSFTFDACYCNNNTIHIINGNANLSSQDTLVVTINAENTSGCTSPYVIQGKYYKQ